MNIPKDGPGGNASGPQTQDKTAHADQTGGLPPVERVVTPTPEHVSGTMPAPLHVAVPHVALSPQDEEPVDPLARLAEIIAQSPTVPVAQPVERVAPVVTAPPAAAFAPVAPQLPPPVAVPQIELVAEDRPAAPAPQPAKKRFSLFRRKAVVSAAPTVAELTEEVAQPKKGFFARRAARKAEAERQKRTGRDRRYARRRRRVWFEELVGWVFVPLILISLYYAAMGILAILGTSPEALLAGLKTIRGHF